MTTNIIRRHLIEYTVQQCLVWGIPLLANSPSNFCWNGEDRTWETGYSNNLYVRGRRILLVPKSVVSYCKRYTPQKYHRHFLLRFLQHEHLRLGTDLVQVRVRRDRTQVRFVTKKSLIERGGAAFDKDFLATFTQAHPDVFADFRAAERTREDSIPIEQLATENIDAICGHLESKLIAIPIGQESATTYHRVVVSILDFLFYPHLTKPSVEQKIHNGRKRIDVTFDNGATVGFFASLSNQAQITCRYVFAECKNYGRDIGNPEIDQLSGRFSVNTGRFGIILCRSVEDISLLYQRFYQRCRDTMNDRRGLVIPLVDEDLIYGLRQRAAGREYALEDRLDEAYRRIALAGN
jgi:hypothetical protein